MKAQIRSARFIKSSARLEECPMPDKPEFAFIGRSNVGKSSLINMLCNHSGLAKVSATPGKTITMNHFLINEEWYLVDLPGYGYARRSRDMREQWEHAMMDYFGNRENLMTVFVLIDSRIPPQDSDMELINALGSAEVPLAIVYTKTDKNSKNETQKNIRAIEKQLLTFWETLPPSFITSSINKTGRIDLLDYISRCIRP